MAKGVAHSPGSQKVQGNFQIADIVVLSAGQYAGVDVDL
jgi:hypothetical protein